MGRQQQRYQRLRCFLRVGKLTVETCVRCDLMAEASLRLRWERCVALVMARTRSKLLGLVEHGQVGEARLSLRQQWGVAVVVAGPSRRPQGILPWQGLLERYLEVLLMVVDTYWW